MDRSVLEPGYLSDTDGWWSCHESTRHGDLALLYRTSLDLGKGDFAHVVAESLRDDPGTFKVPVYLVAAIHAALLPAAGS